MSQIMKFGTLLIVVTVLMSSSFATDAKLKALIIDGQNNHNWRAVTPVLKQDLEECGRFTVDVATTPGHGGDFSTFKPNFSAYDVIVLNYNGDEWSEETKKAFEDYMRNGGGMVCFHASNNSFPHWAEYNKMIAVGGWGGRTKSAGPYLYWKDGKQVVDYQSDGIGGNHGNFYDYTIDIRDTEHPITKGLPLKFRHGTEEVYQQLRGPAENVTILATTYADPKQRGSGRDEPQLMVISYGKGRIFHLVYGNEASNCRSVALIVPLIRGAEWAATGKVTIPVPDDMPTETEMVFRK